MAKGRKSRRKKRRYTSVIARQSLPLQPTIKKRRVRAWDRRRWSPTDTAFVGPTLDNLDNKITRTLSGQKTRRNLATHRGWGPSASIAKAFGTSEALRTKETCRRRRARTEVLHAQRKTGRGGQRKPKWTQESRMRCR